MFSSVTGRAAKHIIEKYPSSLPSKYGRKCSLKEEQLNKIQLVSGFWILGWSGIGAILGGKVGVEASFEESRYPIRVNRKFVVVNGEYVTKLDPIGLGIRLPLYIVAGVASGVILGGIAAATVPLWGPGALIGMYVNEGKNDKGRL